MSRTMKSAVATLLLGALLVGGTALSARASDADAKQVAEAIEKMRAAMLAGDGKTLRSVVERDLSYGHSSGKIQTEDEFIKDLDGKKAFKSLVLSNHTVKIVGNDAIVRHVFDGENNLPDGKTSTAHIGVLQVWRKHPDGWRLLARQAFTLPKT